MSDFTAGIAMAALGVVFLGLMVVFRKRARQAGNDLMFPTVAPLVFAVLFFVFALRLLFFPRL